MTEQFGWQQLIRAGAEAYERYIVSAWMGEWAEALVDSAGIEPGARLLDVACGTGVVARKAAPLVGPGSRIVGLDNNEGMIRAAKHFANRDGMNDLEWRQGDAAAMSFDDGEFDTVLCQQGLQFFPDPTEALKEMGRVLAPGGTLAISVWRSLDRNPYFKILADVIESRLGKQSAAVFHASFSLGNREEVRSLLGDAGFCDIRIRLEVKVARYPSVDEFLPGYLSAIPIAAEIAAMNEADRAEVLRSVTVLLHDYIDDDGLAAPVECHMVTARK